MNDRVTTSVAARLRRLGILIAASSMLLLTGCCSLCTATICGPDTIVDPDGGGEPVERDGQDATLGGRCIPDPARS